MEKPGPLGWRWKRNVTKKSKGIDGQLKTELLPEEIETLNNEELTEKQRLFCLYYVRWFNATKAYQKAYGCDYTTAMVNGCKLLSNPKIQTHIQSIKDAKIKQSMYTIILNLGKKKRLSCQCMDR